MRFIPTVSAVVLCAQAMGYPAAPAFADNAAKQAEAQRIEPLSRPVKAECSCPRPPEEAQIVVLAGYEGGAISSDAVSGFDQETTAAIVTIEEGDAPLYIVAGSFDRNFRRTRTMRRKYPVSIIGCFSVWHPYNIHMDGVWSADYECRCAAS